MEFPTFVGVGRITDMATKLTDKVAIVYAIGALGANARVIIQADQEFDNWEEFVAILRKMFCPLAWDFIVVWILEQLKMKNVNFPEFQRESTTGPDC